MAVAPLTSASSRRKGYVAARFGMGACVRDKWLDCVRRCDGRSGGEAARDGATEDDAAADIVRLNFTSSEQVTEAAQPGRGVRLGCGGMKFSPGEVVRVRGVPSL